MMLPSVGICAVFKNEAPHLREWMLFHQIQGVERFILYDNDSHDAWREEIPELASSVIPWPGTGVQLHAYDNCLAHQAGELDWLAFIDIDEYLWDIHDRTLPELLEPVRARRVQVQWRVFGDGAHATAPNGLTIDAYLRCARELSPIGKQIVRPAKTSMALTPHNFEARGEPTWVPGMRLNHYWTRSEAECAVKFNRGRACINERRPWSEFLAARAGMYEDVDATLSLRYGPILRAELGDA
jgi:hypothetical protein